MIMKSDGLVMSGLNNLIAGHKTDWTKNTLVKYKQSRNSTSKTNKLLLYGDLKEDCKVTVIFYPSKHAKKILSKHF